MPQGRDRTKGRQDASPSTESWASSGAKSPDDFADEERAAASRDGGGAAASDASFSSRTHGTQTPVRMRDIMTEDVQVVSPGATIHQAAQLMDRLNVGVLPVCDGEKLEGMITDRDITVRATAADKPPSDCTVGEVMTAAVDYVFDDDGVQSAMEKMRARQIRRLPVVDRANRLVGIVSLGDLATETDRQIGEVAETLQKVSSPSEPDRSPVSPAGAPEGEMDRQLVRKIRQTTRGSAG